MPEPTVEIVKDLSEVCDVLADAFSVDRAVHEVLGLERWHIRSIYDMFVPLLLGNPGSIVFGIRDETGLVSAAVCQGPGRQPPLWKEVIGGLPLLWKLRWRRLHQLLQLDRLFRQHSPLRPQHLRLALLGTRPAAFRRGYGSTLLRRIDQHALACKLPRVFLETDSLGQPKQLYRRHGYETVQQFDTFAGAVDIMVKTL